MAPIKLGGTQLSQVVESRNIPKNYVGLQGIFLTMGDYGGFGNAGCVEVARNVLARKHPLRTKL